MRHRVYLAPGMFGFGRLTSFDYFGHVRRALVERFTAAGHEVETHVVDVLPTSSVRRRADTLCDLVARTAGDEGPIHLLGHSTGGLDARVAASPGSVLPFGAPRLAWLARLRSVTTMNTPHHGTPLASFFATTRGQQALYALSAFTVMALSLGARPLAVASMLVGVVSRGERMVGIGVPVLRRTVQSMIDVIDDARDPAVRAYLGAIERDSGAMIQLSPEGMDLMLGGFGDRPGVLYQSTASMSPAPGTRSWWGILGHPFRAASLALFSALHAITGLTDHRYPCASMRPDDTPHAGDHNELVFTSAFGSPPQVGDSDGVVPIRSQVWGELAWAGLGDHLDVLGHYHDERPDVIEAERHHDWLTSGSAFDDTAFGALMDAVVAGMLRAS